MLSAMEKKIGKSTELVSGGRNYALKKGVMEGLTHKKDLKKWGTEQGSYVEEKQSIQVEGRVKTKAPKW